MFRKLRVSRISYGRDAGWCERVVARSKDSTALVFRRRAAARGEVGLASDEDGQRAHWNYSICSSPSRGNPLQTSHVCGLFVEDARAEQTRCTVAVVALGLG